MDDNPNEPVPGLPADHGAGNANPIFLTQLGRQYLQQTRPWIRFISVLVFIVAGVMALAGLAIAVMSTVGGLMSRGNPVLGALGGAVIGVFYVALACLYIAPGVFLHRYANAIRLLGAADPAGALENALKQQRSFWRFIGILSLIGVILSILLLGIAVVVGVFGLIMSGPS